MLGAAWEELKAQKLVAMMEAAIQRRFPAGVKLHVHSSDRFGCLAELTQTLHDSQLSHHARQGEESQCMLFTNCRFWAASLLRTTCIV